MFILIGTVVNIILTIVFCFTFMIISIKFLSGVLGPNIAIVLPISIIGGLVLAMFVYQKLSKFAIQRFSLAEKMEPLFGFKNKKSNN